MSVVRLVCLSDTHCKHRKVVVPEGDVLIHAGDMTNHGRIEEIAAFNAWLGELPHPHKIVIAGNHDFLFERQSSLARGLITNAVYLQDQAVIMAGLHFYGSPWQPEFCDWAFNLPRGPALAAKWAQIPSDTDVLVTHGPPQGIRDRTQSEHAGCSDLLRAVQGIKPLVHVFGHIHEGHGETEQAGTRFVNASICNVNNRVTHAPFVVDVVM